MALSNNPTNNQLVKEVKRLEGAKQDTLPNASAAGKVLKSTDAQGGIEWGDASSGGTATDVKVDGTSITSNNEADLITINGNYNASTNKLATASDLPVVDSALSSSSTNTVQNKVIAGRFNNYKTSFTSTQDSYTYFLIESGSSEYTIQITSSAGDNIILSRCYGSRTAIRLSQGTPNIDYIGASGTYGTRIFVGIANNLTRYDFRFTSLSSPSGQTFPIVSADRVSSIDSGTTEITIQNLPSKTSDLTNDGDGTSNFATLADLPASITITTTSGSEAVSDGTNTLNFGSNAFNSTTIPTNTNQLTNGAGFITSSDISGKEDSSNKVTSISSSSTDTQYPSAKCVYDAIQDVAEVAEGKTANYVISDATTGTNIVNTSFNSTQDTVAITVSGNKITDVQGNEIDLSDLKVGDIVSITETAVPDRWVGSIASGTITFYKLETKLDIDTNPTSGSSNAVSSGGVYTALGDKMDKSNPTGTGSLSINRTGTVGTNSVAMNGTATGQGSIAFTNGSATGTNSLAKNGTASNTGAIALGGSTVTASGQYSMATGFQNTSSGTASFTKGQNNTASGANSDASGLYTTANSKCQHTFGEYNVLDTAGSSTTRGNYVEIVGNGTGTSARSNARTLDWSGNEVLAGTLQTAGFRTGLGAGHKLVIPTTNNWTADKTIATTDQIPSTYVSSVNGSSGAITNVAVTNANNNFSTAQTVTGNVTATKFIGGLDYLTTAPSSANTNGLKIVVLSSEPATRYSGYIYIITE